MEFTLGTTAIVQLGNTVTEFLSKHGVEYPCELSIELPQNEFKKVDEDLFYRNNPSSDDEFMPSESEIDVKLNNLRIVIKKKG